MFAEDEAALLVDAFSEDELETAVARRVAGEPLEHVLGWVEFCGLRLAVGPGVFVPRQRTALMARLACGVATPGSVVVELCCGVGPVAAVVASSVAGVEVWAVDIDPAAVAFARRNLPGASVLVGDLDAPLPVLLEHRVDVLAVNTPYVPSAAVAGMPPEARDHEPLVALDGGADGLDMQRRLAAVAPRWLAPGGHVLVEVSSSQASASAALFTAAGLSSRVERDPEIGATVVLAQA